MSNREIIFEMKRLGGIIKVNAIDSLTGTEVTIQGPASTSLSELKLVAARKLKYVLGKQKNEN